MSNEGGETELRKKGRNPFYSVVPKRDEGRPRNHCLKGKIVGRKEGERRSTGEDQK